MKKLYEVTAKVTVFLVAENEDAARDEGQDALRVEIQNGTSPRTVTQVTSKNWALPAEWDKTCLVYGTRRDTTLGSVLARLPDSVKR